MKLPLNNKMKLAVKRSCAALACAALAACGGGGSSGAGTQDQPAKPPEASLSSAVKVVEVSQMQDLIATTITENTQQSTLTVTSNSVLANLPVGQIAFLPPKDANGQEVFVKVESKTQVNGQTQLGVSVPAPHEVFEKIVFNSSIQTGLSTQPVRSTFLPPWVKKDQNAVVSAMRQVGVLDKVFDILDNGEEGLTMEFPLPTTAKTQYLGNAIIEKGCTKPLELTNLEQYETKFKWMQAYCEKPVVIKGKFKHKSPNPTSSFEVTKKGDALEFDADKTHFIDSFTALSGEVGVEADADAAFSDLFSKFTNEDVFGDLNGFSLGEKNGLLQAKFSGLSADDKKGKIPVWGAVVTLAPMPVIPVSGATSSAQIRATAHGSILLMLYVQLDVNVKGEVSAKLVFDATNFNTRMDIKNNQTSVTKTITNKYGEPKMGDVRLDFGSKAEIKGVVGVPVDLDLMIANIRLANFTAGAKAVANMVGNGDVKVGIVPPSFGADLCGKVGYGGGVFGGVRLGLNVEIGSSLFKKRTVGAGFEYALNYPEDEQVSQEPLWFYKSALDGCFSTEAPKPMWVSAKPNYAAMNVGTGVLVPGQVYTLFNVDNQSTGSIDKVRIKYLPRDPFAFISSTPDVSAFANAKSIDNLKWNKDTKQIGVSATDTNGVLLPQGDYDFLIEMTELAFPGLTPRTGTVQGQANLYYPALGVDVATPTLLDKVIFKVNTLWSDVKTVVWTVADSVQSFTSSVVEGVATWETTFNSSGTKTVTASFKDAEDKLLGSKDIGVTVQMGTVTTTAEITQVINDNTTPNSFIPKGTTTTDSTPKITGTVSAVLGSLEQLRVYDNGSGNPIGTATVAADKTWSLLLTTPLASGSHSLSAAVWHVGYSASGPSSTLWTFTVQAATTTTGKLPHTGITASQCFGVNSTSMVSCTSTNATDLNAQQDGHRANINAMSYSLVPNASGGSYAKEECVKDDVTGMIWEGKTSNGTRAGSNTYTNYHSGYFNTQAQMDAASNTYGYVAAVNAERLCGYTDWRMPTADELQSIVDYSKAYPDRSPAINTTWFPNTFRQTYWSSTPRADYFGGAWRVDFTIGSILDLAERSEVRAVRLVRVSQ
jgi:hypothetical protein